MFGHMANGRGFHHPAPYWMARVCPVGGFPPVPTRGWFIPPPNSFFDVLFPPYILHRVDMKIAKKMFKQISSSNSLVYKNMYAIDSSTWSLYWLELLHFFQWSGFSLYLLKYSCKTLRYFPFFAKKIIEWRQSFLKTNIKLTRLSWNKIVMESWPHGRKPWATTPFGPGSALHTVLLHQYWIKSPKKGSASSCCSWLPVQRLN